MLLKSHEENKAEKIWWSEVSGQETSWRGKKDGMKPPWENGRDTFQAEAMILAWPDRT